MFRQRITRLARVACTTNPTLPRVPYARVARRPLPFQTPKALKTREPLWTHPGQIKNIVCSTNELKIVVYTVSKTIIFEFDSEQSQSQFINNLKKYIKDYPVDLVYGESVNEMWEGKYHDVDDQIYRNYLRGKYNVDDDDMAHIERDLTNEYDHTLDDDHVDRLHREYLEGKYDIDEDEDIDEDNAYRDYLNGKW